MAVYFTNDPSKISKEELPAFPRSRYDCGAFVWEEALLDGNYCLAASSAQGGTTSPERLVKFLRGFRADHSHFMSFEVAVDGMILKDHFTFEEENTKTTEDGELHTVSLMDQGRGIRVRVKTLLDGTSFLTRWLEVENCSSTAAAVTGLFPLAGILYPEVRGNTFMAEHLRPDYEVGSFADNYYLAEGEFFWQKVPKATLKFGHERALFNPPMYVLRDTLTGIYTMLHIETGMMTQAEFTRGGDYYYARHVTNQDYLHFKVGLDERFTRYTLLPGGSIVSPKIHITQMYGGLDACINASNAHLRRSVIPKRDQPVRYPVEYNHSSYSENCQINLAYLKKEIDIAAAVGAEIFVVDAGWFGAADSMWCDCRGDWFENPLLENGLAEAFDYARSKGLLCGMWMEFEAMDFGSELAKQHPEWFVKGYHRDLPVLNLLIPEAREYAWQSVSGAIRKYRLDLFRIDGGLKEPMDFCQNPGSVGDYADYYETLYEMIDKLREEFPGIYLENCSGGGGRSDLAILRHFDWMQATDNFAPESQLRTIYGMSYALAPEQLLSITGAFMAHPTDADFMARSCILGRPEISGLADRADRIHPHCLGSWTHAVELYKNELRPMLGESLVYHHTPPERYMERGNWLVMELASPDQNKSIGFLFRLEGAEECRFTYRPKGISLSADYLVTFDNTGETVSMTGLSIQRDGIPVDLPGRCTSELLMIKKIED